jgi:hypothetical protein
MLQMYECIMVIDGITRVVLIIRDELKEESKEANDFDSQDDDKILRLMRKIWHEREKRGMRRPLLILYLFS